MKILCFDTSTETLSAGLFDGNSELISIHDRTLTRHSDTLALRLQGLLKKSRMTWDRLDGIVVGLGPGSFTGLRVGVTMAKTLSYALKKKLWGVSSLEGLAFQDLDWEGDLCVIMDAKGEKVYTATFHKKKSAVKLLKKPAIRNIQELLTSLREKTFFIGNAVAVHQEKLIEKKSICRFGHRDAFTYPTAGGLKKAAMPKINKTVSDNLFKVEPLYLYPRDCNVSIKKRAR